MEKDKSKREKLSFLNAQRPALRLILALRAFLESADSSCFEGPALPAFCKTVHATMYR